MGIIAKFIKSNIKSAKASVIVLIFSVAICSIIFVFSLAVPYYIETFVDITMRKIYGNSDIYITNPNQEVQRFASLSDIPNEIKDKTEYIYGIFINQLNFQVNSENIVFNLLGVNFDELIDFNSPELTTNLETLNDFEIVISSTLAKNNNLKVGDNVYTQYNGYPKAFKVVGISKKANGIFSDEKNTVISKGTMKKLVGSFYNENMFNLGLVKLNNQADYETVFKSLEETFPDFSVIRTADPYYVSFYVNMIKAPFFAIVAIVMLFCAFIILLSCSIIFTERLKNFATLKSLGATNKQIIAGLIAESCIYGLIGSIFSILFMIVLIFIMQFAGLEFMVHLPIKYYLFTMLFGMGFSMLFSLFPAIINSRKSIRQTMIISTKSKLKNIIYLTMGCSFLLIGIICLILSNTSYSKNYALPIVVCFILSSVILAPFVIFALIKFLSVIFKRFAGFNFIYTKSNILSSPVSMIVRLMTFGFLVFMLLNCLPGTMKTQMNDFPASAVYDLVGTSDKTNIDLVMSKLEEFDSIKYVFKYHAYPREPIEYIKRKNISRFFSVPYNSITDIFAKDIYGDNLDNILDKMNSETQPYLLLGSSYAQTGEYDIGDYMIFELYDDIITFRIAGFINTSWNMGQVVIANYDKLIDYGTDHLTNDVMIKLNDYKKDLALFKSEVLSSNSSIIKDMGIADDSSNIYAVLGVMDSLIVLIYFYAYLVMALGFIAIVIGLLLSLKQNILQHKIMSLLGMNTKIYMRAFVFLVFCIAFLSTFLSFVASMPVFGNLADMITSFGTYVVLDFAMFDKLLACFVAFGASMIICPLVAKTTMKDFLPKMIIEEG